MATCLAWYELANRNLRSSEQRLESSEKRRIRVSRALRYKFQLAPSVSPAVEDTATPTVITDIYSFTYLKGMLTDTKMFAALIKSSGETSCGK